MKGALYLLTILGVIGLAVWSYGQNDQTQRALTEARQLRAEIQRLTEALEVQRAEWAFLNRPDRLRHLADMNFDHLGLAPMTADRFGRIEDIAFPLLVPQALPEDP